MPLPGFLHSSVGKEITCNAGDPGSIPGSGTYTGEGKGYPFQYSGLENSIDCTVHGVIDLDTTERFSLSPIAKLIKSFFTNVQYFIF